MIVMKSANVLLDAMLSMPDDGLESLVVINCVRMACSVVLLIKMSATTTAPNSELGKTLDTESSRVDFYLKTIISRLKNFSEYRVANKLMQIVVKVTMRRHQHLAINGFNFGQGVQQLLKPLFNLALAEVEEEAKQEGGKNKRSRPSMCPFFVPEGSTLPWVQPVPAKDKFGSVPAPTTFNLEALSYKQSAPSDRSTVSANESNHTQTTQSGAGSSSVMASEMPQRQGGSAAHQQWFMPPMGPVAIRLLLSVMDLDIYALSEGMEFSALDLSAGLPPEEEGMYRYSCDESEIIHSHSTPSDINLARSSSSLRVFIPVFVCFYPWCIT